MSAAVVARTIALLNEIPDDQLSGPSPTVDALETLTDDELVTTAAAMAETAKAATQPSIQAKAVRVLKAAQTVASTRETARARIAATRPFPGVFAQSKAGAAITAVAARRDRLGQPGGSQPAGGTQRRAMGPLTYYNLWVSQGKWGRQGGGMDQTVSHFGIKGGPVKAAAASIDLRPRDAIEAAALGDPQPLAAQGLRGLGSLQGLNLGKFFKNLVKDVGPVASLASAFIPGVGMAVAPIIGAVTAAVGGGGGGGQPLPLQAGVPVQGPPVLTTQAPQAAPSQASGFPAWGWAALAGGGLLLLAGRK